MTEPFLDPALEGQRRREALDAKHQALADNMTQASMLAHQQHHDAVTAVQHGIFGPGDSPQQMAAEVAERPVRIGQDFGGGGRALEARGATYRWADVSDSPAPAVVDLRPRRPGQRATGESPLLRHMRGQA